MDSKLLRTFVAVANHGSFTGAAKELYIAQSAVSKHINQLERELGAQLFLRDTRMVRLTAAGEGFYRDSVDILRRMDAARTALQREQGGEHGRLALGAFSVVPTEIVALARRFHACWSGVELSLDWFEFGTLLERLESGDLDVAFTMAFELLDRPHLRRRTVGRGRMYVLLGSQSPLAGAKQLYLKDLAELTYYTMRPDVTPNGYVNMMRFFAEKEFQPRRSLRHTSHESMMLQLQVHDDAYGLMGDFQYRDHPGLVFLPLAEEDQPGGDAFDRVAVWRERNENPNIPRLLTLLGEDHPELE